MAKASLRPGDKVTMRVDAQFPRDHKKFCAIAKKINAGKIGTIKAVYTGRAAKRYDFNEPCVCVEFLGTAWANGVVSAASEVTKVAAEIDVNLYFAKDGKSILKAETCDGKLLYISLPEQAVILKYWARYHDTRGYHRVFLFQQPDGSITLRRTPRKVAPSA